MEQVVLVQMRLEKTHSFACLFQATATTVMVVYSTLQVFAATTGLRRLIAVAQRML